MVKIQYYNAYNEQQLRETSINAFLSYLHSKWYNATPRMKSLNTSSPVLQINLH